MMNYKDYFSKNYSPEKSEEVLLELRNRGISQMEITLLLCDQLGLTLVEASRVVHDSETWRDRKKINENYTQKLGDTMTNLKD